MLLIVILLIIISFIGYKINRPDDENQSQKEVIKIIKRNGIPESEVIDVNKKIRTEEGIQQYENSKLETRLLKQIPGTKEELIKKINNKNNKEEPIKYNEIGIPKDQLYTNGLTAGRISLDVPLKEELSKNRTYNFLSGASASKVKHQDGLPYSVFTNDHYEIEKPLDSTDTTYKKLNVSKRNSILGLVNNPIDEYENVERYKAYKQIDAMLRTEQANENKNLLDYNPVNRDVLSERNKFIERHLVFDNKLSTRIKPDLLTKQSVNDKEKILSGHYSEKLDENELAIDQNKYNYKFK
tara:strand:+ start:1962 stop:2852 length:891 start_codon:yes stop_codon:yes gene_type:complete